MHPNRKFHWQDRDAMRHFVASAGFGTLVVQSDDGLRAVHLPALLDGETLRFHVARGNAAHAALAAGGRALFVVNGPDAYVSPDWYGMADRVPTWDYVAVEMEGPVRPLPEDELVRLLDDLSAEHEARLAPKRPWTRDKMDPARFDGLLKAITGFALEIAHWRGTRKLGQDKPDHARAGVAAALGALGRGDMAALYAAAEAERA